MIKIEKRQTEKSIAQEIQEIAGVDINACYQCKKCSSGCPVAKMVETPPSEIIRRLQLGQGRELLKTELVWACTSCETCSTRCPMGIDVAAVMDAMRSLAIQKKMVNKKDSVPAFNRAFLNSVKRFGRTYELAMISAYKLTTRKFMQDTDRFPTMIKKRKIALLPSFKANKKIVKRIFKYVADKGKQK